MFNIFLIFSIATISAEQFQYILNEVGSIDDIQLLTQASIRELKSVSQKKKSDIESAFEKYEDFVKELQVQEIEYITIAMQNYPTALKELYDFPYILYFKGNLSLLQQFSIGIIGSRKPDAYGVFCADFFGKILAENGIITVSGMAHGIDGISQKSTVNYGGKTIAVLGSSLNEKSIYPKTNLSLYHRILDNGGLILSEYHHRESTLPYKFVARNRIISAICSGLIVVEANFKSGTMTTVEFALELGKTIFSVPGNINSSNSNGTNQLIKNGAKIVTCFEDILEEFPNITPLCSALSKSSNLSEAEQNILSLLEKKSPIYIDEIAYTLQFQIKEVSSILSILEIKGFVLEMGNNLYSLTSI